VTRNLLRTTSQTFLSVLKLSAWN